MDMKRILVVEDDEAIASGLVRVLTGQGYTVKRIGQGSGAVRAADPSVGLVLLDLGLPDVDGMDVCRRLRAARPDLAILILTARDHELDVVAGLDAGADDYLVKPFDFGELLARVRALQRRPRGVDSPIIVRGSLELDPVRRQVSQNGRALNLTATEFSILEILMRRTPAVVERKAVAEHAWRDETDPLGSNTIDVQMSRLRAKLVNSGVRVLTVRGAGFRLEVS